MITVTIPADPPSKLFPNQASKQGSWHVRARVRKESREIAAYAAMNARTATCPIAGPVAVEIHAAYGHRRRLPDIDATSSAAKAFLDGVVDAGILYDDDQVVRWTVTHEKLPSRPKAPAQGFTTITITEIDT